MEPQIQARESKNKFNIWIIGGVIVFALLIIAGIAKSGNSQKPVNDTVNIEASIISSVIPTPTPTPEADYSEFFQVKINRDRGSVINYKLLIKPEDEFMAEDIANFFFKKCTKNCTIDIYNEEKALNLAEDYDQRYMKSETTPEDLKTWEKKNYIYVADHYVGRIDFDGKFYNDYPLKDSYYKELGGKN